jgi:transposase InsO family protein
MSGRPKVGGISPWCSIFTRAPLSAGRWEAQLTAALSTDVLTLAVWRRTPKPGLTPHSHRDIQSAAGDYQRLLTEHGIASSMSRTGNCWDNAGVEIFSHIQDRMCLSPSLPDAPTSQAGYFRVHRRVLPSPTPSPDPRLPIPRRVRASDGCGLTPCPLTRGNLRRRYSASI